MSPSQMGLLLYWCVRVSWGFVDLSFSQQCSCNLSNFTTFLLIYSFCMCIFSLFPSYAVLSPSRPHSLSPSLFLVRSSSLLWLSQDSPFFPLFSLSFCLSWYYFVHLPPLLSTLEMCVVILKGLIEPSKQCFRSVVVSLTSSVCVTGQAFMSASKDHTHKFTDTCRHIHTQTTGDERNFVYPITLLGYNFKVLLYSFYIHTMLYFYSTLFTRHCRFNLEPGTMVLFFGGLFVFQ